MSWFREQVVKRIQRSDEWPALSRLARKFYGECASCGTKKRLETHHIKPFSLFPSLELSWENLIVLCFW